MSPRFLLVFRYYFIFIFHSTRYLRRDADASEHAVTERGRHYRDHGRGAVIFRLVSWSCRKSPTPHRTPPRSVKINNNDVNGYIITVARSRHAYESTGENSRHVCFLPSTTGKRFYERTEGRTRTRFETVVSGPVSDGTRHLVDKIDQKRSSETDS